MDLKLFFLVHELGHRYDFKFATAGQKRNIAALYSKLKSDARWVDVPELKAGEFLPVNLRGEITPRKITKVTPLSYELGSGVSVKISAVEGILKRKAVEGKLFPSGYSMKNPTEFFAECFAFYVLGRLSPALAVKFEEALKG